MARFRLERVRRVREQLRRQAERAVGETLQAIAANEAHRVAVQQAQADDWNAAIEQLVAGTTSDVLELHARYATHLTAEAAAAAEHATRLATELERRRVLVRAARIEERKLDQLRARFVERTTQAAERMSNRILDELALRQHVTRR